MSHHSQQGYRDHPQEQVSGGSNPSQPSAYDYPPRQPPSGLYRDDSHLEKSASSWSLDEPNPLASEVGYSAVRRDHNTPADKEFQSGNETAPSPNKVRKWALIVAGILILVGVIVGIVAWRVTASKNGSSSSSSGSGKLQYIDGTSQTVRSNPDDPSKFEKDSRLKPIFYGMAYTPLNSYEPSCGATLANVTEDMQLLSQLTTRIRTYGAACNQSELILQAIKDTKVNMTVWLGAYISDNATVNAQQQDLIIEALDKYGTKHVGGVTIGDEYPDQADSTGGRVSRIDYLIEQMSAFRTRLAAKKYKKTLPVGTSDGGGPYGWEANGTDYYMAKVHPWLSGLNVNDAASYVLDYSQYVQRQLAPISTKPTAYIGETGWPTGSLTPENATLEEAVAGVSELQTFLDTFPCQANQNGSYYFYYEPFDKPANQSNPLLSWPFQEHFGDTESYWGLFDHNRKLKNVTFPDCAVDSTKASG